MRVKSNCPTVILTDDAAYNILPIFYFIIKLISRIYAYRTRKCSDKDQNKKTLKTETHILCKIVFPRNYLFRVNLIFRKYIL